MYSNINMYVNVNFLHYHYFWGERVVGRGSDLYQLCKDIDDTIKGTFVNFYASV